MLCLARLLIVELATASYRIWAHLINKKTAPFGAFFLFMGRVTRFELATFGTTNRRSNQLSYTRHNFIFGGADQTRTDDPLHAMQVLYQLSYNPMRKIILYFFLPKVK